MIQENTVQSSYWWKTLLAGGVAGVTAKSLTAPLDRVKILMQGENLQYSKHYGNTRYNVISLTKERDSPCLKWQRIFIKIMVFEDGIKVIQLQSQEYFLLLQLGL